MFGVSFSSTTKLMKLLKNLLFEIVMLMVSYSVFDNLSFILIFFLAENTAKLLQTAEYNIVESLCAFESVVEMGTPCVANTENIIFTCLKRVILSTVDKIPL